MNEVPHHKCLHSILSNTEITLNVPYYYNALGTNTTVSHSMTVGPE